jgi:hypothetical protein
VISDPGAEAVAVHGVSAGMNGRPVFDIHGFFKDHFLRRASL